MKDSRLSLCLPSTRGVWIDLICAMHEADRSGELRGTAEQLARLARCSTVELVHALTDLQTTGAAAVSQRNGTYIVANRRMQRDYEIRRKRAISGALGGSKTQAKRKQPPDNDNDICFEGKKKGRLTDSEFILALKSNPAYSHINVDRELSKMDAWLLTPKAKGRKKTPGFIVNWLNKIEAPIATSRAAKPAKEQPAGWRDWLSQTYPDAKERDYWRVPGDVQREFHQRKKAA